MSELLDELEATTIGELVRLRAALGDRPFLSIEGAAVSYEELDARSDRIAGGLVALGLRKGDIVATLMYNSIEHVLLWIAAAKLGIVWAPLNVSLIQRDLAYTLIDTTARLFVVDARLLDGYESVREAVREQLPDLLEIVHGHVEGYRLSSELDREPVSIDEIVLPSDPACITYTGGSTGLPKGVVVPHLLYLATAFRYSRIIEPRDDDVHFSNGHLFHVAGQQCGVLGPLYARIGAVMTEWFSASQYWDRARAAGATIIDPVGPMLGAILARTPPGRDRDHSVRLGVDVGSGQVLPEMRSDFEQRFGVDLYEAYGQTEAGVMLCSESSAFRRRGSAGHPDATGWAEIAIVDDEERAVPAGVEGKIRLRPKVAGAFMLGYHNKPDLTIGAWQNLWFHTGDLGYLDEDGFLHFKGREAHWIRRRGENVSAFEVEQVVGEHPAVVDCAVVGVPAPLGDEDVKVYVRLAPEATVDPAELVEWARERLAYFKVPRYVEFVEDFPRSVTKKEIERHTLRARGIGNAWDAGDPVRGRR